MPTKKPSYLYPALVVALFCLIVGVVFMAPPVQLALIDQNRNLLVVGDYSFTTGDVIAIVSLLAACVDITSLLLYMKLRSS